MLSSRVLVWLLCTGAAAVTGSDKVVWKTSKEPRWWRWPCYEERGYLMRGKLFVTKVRDVLE